MIKQIIHWIFQSYKVREKVKDFAKNINNKKILEIGSGQNPSGKYFDYTNSFKTSDIDTINAVNMDFKEEFDVIICINVLDDIFEVQKAIDNIYNALKENGQVFVIVPAFYPIHDIPNDYWRFTEFSLRKLFLRFNNIEVSIIGLKRFPSYYVLTGIK